MEYSIRVCKMGKTTNRVGVSTDYEGESLEAGDLVLVIYHENFEETEFNSLDIIIKIDNIRAFIEDLRGLRDNYNTYNIKGYFVNSGEEIGHPGHNTKCIVCDQDFANKNPKFISITDLSIHRGCLNEIIESVQEVLNKTELVTISL